MVTPPPTWQRLGGMQVLTLVPPTGRGRVRVHERLPLTGFDAVVATLLAEDLTFRPAVVSPVSRLVSLEGEYGAWVGLAGSASGARVHRWIGALCGDDFVLALDGVSREPTLDDVIQRATRWLLQHASLGLGARRRRHLYQPPPGWFGLLAGLCATYRPPGFPRERAQLEVHPAEPSALDAGEALEQLLADEERRGFIRSGALAAEPCQARHGLAGRLVKYAGRWPSESERAEHTLAVLADGRYRYCVRAEELGACASRPEEALRALVATIEPLPRAREHRPASGTAMELGTPWVE
jgi:hypothetical protein